MTFDKTLDMCGRPCPEPVIETRKALGAMAAGTLTVVVDNEDSAENVFRAASGLGLATEIEVGDDGLHRVCIQKTGIPSVMPRAPESSPPAVAADAAKSKTAVLVASDRFGEGEPELGDVLIRAFIKTLRQLTPPPAHLIFVNSGVKLAVQDSVLVDDIKSLEDAGTAVLCCGTCLDYYHLKEKLSAGRVSNMFEIVSALSEADRTIRP